MKGKVEPSFIYPASYDWKTAIKMPISKNKFISINDIRNATEEEIGKLPFEKYFIIKAIRKDWQELTNKVHEDSEWDECVEEEEEGEC